ncbi:uncharacterized protein BDW70DRAFT_145596 [Aspergillus foveolatus]|uniref:uncharacterized protein n=1 Tax=Aspergillus foveolatus TaxID=210207 RepID=UPI003CCDD756
MRYSPSKSRRLLHQHAASLESGAYIAQKQRLSVGPMVSHISSSIGDQFFFTLL